MKGVDKMLKEIFEIVSNNSEQVVLKVNADDPLTVAMNPYVSGEYAYVTVTKGTEHILTPCRPQHWRIPSQTEPTACHTSPSPCHHAPPMA